jgi:two-component system, NarL family, nitrate/nitrite response regulator NarL
MRVVVCDDHRLFVEPFAAALSKRGHDVVLTTSLKEGIRAVATRSPDICVIDLRFPEGSGIAAVTYLRSHHPSCAVAVLSASSDVRDLRAATAAGAAGYLRKDQPISAIFDAIEKLAAGRKLTALPAPRPPTGSDENAQVRRLLRYLTIRERQVLRCLVEAEGTDEIARTLGVAPSTARTHVQNVLLKLGAHTRLQAVTLVVGAGLEREL